MAKIESTSLRRVASALRKVREDRGITLPQLAEMLGEIPGAPDDADVKAMSRLERYMDRKLPIPRKGLLLRAMLAALDIPLHPVLVLGGAWPPLARPGGVSVVDQCIEATCAATGYEVLRRWPDGRVEIGPKGATK